MSTASEVTIKALAFIVKPLPLGTNLAVLHLLWALLSGAFLSSRGAVFPALLSLGLSAAQIRRSSQAVRAGSWSSDELLARWRIWVAAQGAWQPDSYEGYQPLGVDITTFWRPRLGGWLGKFFNQVAQRALLGIGFALVVQVGHSGGQRLPLLKHIIRASNAADSERQLKATALATVGQHLAAHEVVVHDAGASIADMQTAQIGRYVVRLDRNCTARRNALPPRCPRRGRPTLYGTLVRPLARTYRQHALAATAPDVTTQFVHAGATIQAQGWRAVVRADQPVAPDNPTFTIWVFHSPRYPTPLVLGTNLPAQAVTILQLYLDRWPVEEVPLVSKQLLGVERQFVFAAEARYRLPELAEAWS